MMWCVLLTLLYSLGWSISLEETLRRAVSYNPQIQAQRYHLEASRYQLFAEKSLYLPEIFINGQWVHQSEAQSFFIPILQFTQQVQSTKRNYTQWSAGIRQTLWDGGYREGAVYSAREEVSYRRYLFEEKLQEVKLEVIKAYLDTLKALRLVEVYRQQKEAIQAQYETARAFYQKGLVAVTDVLQAKVRLSEVERTLRTAEGEYRVALANLSRLTGIKEEELTPLEEPTLQEEDRPLSYWLDMARSKRPILKALVYLTESTRSKVLQARSQFIPKLWFQGEYVYTDQNPALYPKGFFRFSLGLSVSFQGIRPYYQAMALEKEVYRLMKEQEDTLGKVELEVRSSYEKWRTSLDNLRVAEDSLALARQYYQLSKEQYANQIITQTDLLASQASLTKAEADLVIARYEHMKALYELKKAAGVLP